MYFWASSRCRIKNSVEKAAVFLHPLYIIGLKFVPRDYMTHLLCNGSHKVNVLSEYSFCRNIELKFMSNLFKNNG